jgi:hypothetical protein
VASGQACTSGVSSKGGGKIATLESVALDVPHGILTIYRNDLNRGWHILVDNIHVGFLDLDGVFPKDRHKVTNTQSYRLTPGDHTYTCWYYRVESSFYVHTTYGSKGKFNGIFKIEKGKETILQLLKEKDQLNVVVSLPK